MELVRGRSVGRIRGGMGRVVLVLPRGGGRGACVCLGVWLGLRECLLDFYEAGEEIEWRIEMGGIDNW